MHWRQRLAAGPRWVRAAAVTVLAATWVAGLWLGTLGQDEDAWASRTA